MRTSPLAALAALAALVTACDDRPPGQDSAASPAPERAPPRPGAAPASSEPPWGLLEGISEPPPDSLPTTTGEDREREGAALAAADPARAAEVRRLRQLASLRPGDANARFELGDRLHGLALLREAERELLAAVAADPALARAHFLLADVYLQRSESGRALWHAHRALESEPGDAENYKILATVLRESGALERAARATEAGLALHPSSANLRVLRGRLHLDASEPERAAEELRAALATSPDHMQAHLILGKALAALGRDDEAQAELAQHAELLVLRELGLLGHGLEPWQRAAVVASHHRAEGRFDAGRAEAERSLALAPDNVHARVILAQIDADEGRHAEAVERLERVLADEPAQLRARRVLALVLCDAPPGLRDAERALRLADEAVRGNGSDAQAHYARGVALSALDRQAEARAAFGSVLALEPGHVEARRAREQVAGE